MKGLRAAGSQIADQNRQFQSITLAPSMFEFMKTYSKTIKAKFADGEELTGDMIVNLILSGVTSISDQQQKIGQTLDTLSLYTGLVDVDANAAR
jgi:hypothetical protein